MKNEIMNTPKCRKMNTQSEMDRDWFKRGNFHYLVKLSAEQRRATWNLPPNSRFTIHRLFAASRCRLWLPF
ncbi:MAG: hypothetical protein WAN11_03990, partial [Syntrophobacteraceae bacterium]